MEDHFLLICGFFSVPLPTLTHVPGVSRPAVLSSLVNLQFLPNTSLFKLGNLFRRLLSDT